MFLENLKLIYQKNGDKNPLFLRSLLKESVQFYVLNFIFNSTWGKKLVMKGGTCLKFCFDLPRLSEDLDFDIESPDKFNIDEFISDISGYFVKTLQFSKIQTKLANNKRTIYLKFPILADLGFSIGKNESNIIHVRIDLTPAPVGKYQTEISIKSTADFSFLIRRYSLADLFAGKICAILKRESLEGTTKEERFKGRDYFDLIWFGKEGVPPNWEFVKEVTKFDKDEVIRRLKYKADKVTPAFLREDLLPFLADADFGQTFSKNFPVLFGECLKKLK